jgi:hypothetical protein
MSSRLLADGVVSALARVASARVAVWSGGRAVVTTSRFTSLGCAALAALVLACGGGETAPRLYSVSRHALSDDGDPLPGVELLASGNAVGRTDAHGGLLVRLSGREGAQVTFEPRCPQGSSAQGNPASLRLRTLGNGPPPDVELTCARAKRLAALIVSAPGFAGLPVLVHNRELARTDATGTAHVLLEGDPATPLRVVLNTESRPKLVPPSPHKDLQIGTRDDIVVFAPNLSEVRDPPPPKKHRLKKEKPPPVLRPEKLR